MIKRTRSTPRPKLESAPSKSEGVALPPLNLQNSPESSKNSPAKLVINNFVAHYKHKSFDNSFEPRAEIEALHKLCNQLVKGQEELRQRLQQQEIIIEQLRLQGKVVKVKREASDGSQPRRVETLSRRLPAFTPRASEESGFFTFRPLETEKEKEKQKFPREIFSRKSRVRPYMN
jgi:hypothetical protein